MFDQKDEQFIRAPWHFNATDCAAVLGLAKSSFSERSYEPCGVVGRQKFYDLRAVIRADVLTGLVEADDGEMINHEAEKARLTKARRVAQELENARTEKELRPIQEVEAAIYDALSPVAAALESLPMGIKRVCPELSQSGVEMVEREIATMRNALADDHIYEPSAADA